MPLVIASVLLAGVLAFAVGRPRGLPEAVVAVPAALLVLAFGLVPWRDALGEVRELGSTVAFLAAVLVLAQLAGSHGVFRYAGQAVARISGGSPRRLLLAVFVAASITTAVLSLDATVVLLTPVVFATAAHTGARPRPHVYASAHLANSASLLLPVSNLTNLLAFAASGLTFLGFAAVMALPWLAVIAVEYAAFRWFFRADLTEPAEPVAHEPPGKAPRYALAVLALTLIGFAVAQPMGVPPGWIAVAGAAALAVPLRPSPATLISAANPAFCAFVLALGVVVLAVREHGLGSIVDTIVPERDGLAGLLIVSALAAVLANLLNNLPATLVLLPAVHQSPGLILAVLIGVNVGPNLTYVGSLANLLWRRVIGVHAPGPLRFSAVGATTVPLTLLAATTALWAALHV